MGAGLSLALASALSLSIIGWMALPVVDDAAISIAYGLSFWEGYGFRLTHHSGIVEGFTSPAWAVITGLWAALGGEPLQFARWAGSVLGTLGMMVLASSQAILERRGPNALEVTAGFVSLAFPSLAFWLSSGMETGLALLSMVLAYLLVHEPRARAGHVGLGLASLVTIRPEFVVTGAALVIWWSWSRRRSVVAVGVFGAGLAVLLLARRAYFGEWLPNTWFVKRHWDFGGARYVWDFLVMHRWMFAGSLLSACVVLWSKLRGQLASVSIVIGSALWFAFDARGDWMREWRFLVWVLPFGLTPVLLGWSSVRSLDLHGARRRVQQVALLAASAMIMFGALGQLQRFEGLKASPEFPADFVMKNARQLKTAQEGIGAVRPHLGLPDVGGLALVFRDAAIADVAGLTDYAMAHAPGTAAMEDYLLNEGPPMVIDAHGPSGHVAFKALRPWFVGWSHGVATMTGLTRDEDPRCPGQKATLLEGDAASLESRLSRLMDQGQPVAALRLWRCADTYLSDEKRLTFEQRRALSADAQEQAARLQTSDRLLALRYWSLATVLAEEEPALRRHTERLRAELFPGQAAP